MVEKAKHHETDLGKVSQDAKKNRVLASICDEDGVVLGARATESWEHNFAGTLLVVCERGCYTEKGGGGFVACGKVRLVAFG